MLRIRILGQLKVGITPPERLWQPASEMARKQTRSNGTGIKKQY